MTTAPETDSGATPEPVESTGAGAIPADSGKPEAAGGATPPVDGSGLEAALKAERESRRKAEAELKRLRPQATDAEALAVRVAELEEAAARSAREALVQKVANDYSIPSVLRDRIHGQTEDEIRADAEILRAALPTGPQPPTQTTQSVGGPQGGPPSVAKSPEEWTSFLRSKRL